MKIRFARRRTSVRRAQRDSTVIVTLSAANAFVRVPNLGRSAIGLLVYEKVAVVHAGTRREDSARYRTDRTDGVARGELP